VSKIGCILTGFCCRQINFHFEEMIDEMVGLCQHFDLKIFGGCCGTNDQFIENLSEKLSRL